MTDTFKEVPISVAERRAAKEANASLWSPRDVLLQALRELDTGEIKPEALIIVWREQHLTNKAQTFTCYSTAAPDMHVVLGMLARAAYQINEG